ncbi:hypothetical protein DFH27DRAFT_485842 [Peziza echinospora]|nr:hypothetical protein DFH27DRAFT_485842 [Peziza echinospora]
MADQQNLGALLAALSQQRPPSQPPHQSAMHAQIAQNIANLSGAPQQSSSGSMQGNFALPQPTSSGALDLSNIKPVNSGTVSLADAIARAKTIAAERGVSAYRNEAQGSGGGGAYGRGRSRSRSRSPPPRRDTYRDGYNPYRDERRGRNFERERSYSPPRRNGPYSPPSNRGGGGGRDKNPDALTEQMHIESGLVGLIIGRGGETLRRVEQETGARVQFLTGADHRDTPERLCNIIGTRPQIAAARQQISQIIEDNAKGPGSNTGGSGGPPKRSTPSVSSHQPPLRDGEDSLQIMVPDRTVGLIIGRGGETIRDLQERSGCHINIVGEQKSVNGLRPVNLIGSAESAKRAKDLIMEIVDSDIRSQATPGGGGPGPQAPSSNHGGGSRDRGSNSQGGYNDGGFNVNGGRTGDKVTEIIRVPIDAVGMIIGKGGETIKEMQSTTGCRINVSSQFHPSDVEREISLQGPKDAILRARKAIEDKVEASQHSGSGGGGGGGGFGGGDHRGGNNNNDRDHRDRDYNNNVAAAADPADPYAPWGGYQNYVAMYYAMLAQQGGAGGGAPGTGGPPGAPGT